MLHIVGFNQFKQIIVQSKEATALFNKKDGTERIMRFTIDIDQIPGANRPKGESRGSAKRSATLKSNQMMTVYDLDKDAWRIISFNTCKWLVSRSIESDESIRYDVVAH